MGYSVRTSEWDVPPIGIELYDHRNERSFPTNFDIGENDNIFSQYNNSNIVKTLAEKLRSMFVDDPGKT